MSFWPTWAQASWNILPDKPHDETHGREHGDNSDRLRPPHAASAGGGGSHATRSQCVTMNRPNGPRFSGRKSKRPTRAPRSSTIRRACVSFRRRSSHSRLNSQAHLSSLGRYRRTRPFVAGTTTGRASTSYFVVPRRSWSGVTRRQAAAIRANEPRPLPLL